MIDRKMPICPYSHEDCAARRNLHCVALRDPSFKSGECAFYKSKEQNEVERRVCSKRLNDLNLTKVMGYYPKVIDDECEC